MAWDSGKLPTRKSLEPLVPSAFAQVTKVVPVVDILVVVEVSHKVMEVVAPSPKRTILPVVPNAIDLTFELLELKIGVENCLLLRSNVPDVRVVKFKYVPSLDVKLS
jgi:hypothetical protein